MEQFELLTYLVTVFDRLDLDYFIAGSIATSFYGEPRFTNDIDVIVVLVDSDVESFCEAFPSEEFYLSQPAVTSAVQKKQSFNILQPKTGLKVDVFVYDDSPLEKSRLERRVQKELADGLNAWLACPEDTILKKLCYFAEGNSDKHVRDILGVLKIQQETIDITYLSYWANQLGLADLWRDLMARNDARRTGTEDKS